MPTYYGQDLAIRIFDTQRGIITLESLGYVQEEYDALRRLLDIPSGMILVAGPTASGKSNSMYAFVDFLNDGTRKIHTLEDPIEYLLPGIVQSQVNHHVGLDFPELLFTVLRHSPDVIMIGEIRDMRTAEIAVRAANSGQLVLATVHAQSAASAIQSMMVYGVDSRFLANSIIGIVSQRLVRRLCSKCRIPIEDDTMPDPIAEIRNQLKSDPPLQWCLPNGCGHCRETGFDRLNLIAEVLEINPEIRALISEHASVEQLQAAAVENGMLTLEHSARINIASGLTTPEEVSRVLGGMGISQLSAAIRELEKNKAATATLTAASPA